MGQDGPMAALPVEDPPDGHGGPPGGDPDNPDDPDNQFKPISRMPTIRHHARYANEDTPILKLPKPTPFDGCQENAETFLHQLALQFAANPQLFPDN